MISSSDATRYNGKTVPRQNFLWILQAAFDSHSYRFARQAALNWLAIYPGDLGVNLLLAKALLGDGKDVQASNILEKLVRLDPEFAAAWETLALAQQKGLPGDPGTTLSCARALSKTVPGEETVPEWGATLLRARNAIQKGMLDEAETLIHQGMGQQPELPLAAVLHLKLAAARGDDETVNQLAGLYHFRWPDCLQFSLYLAETKIQLGDDNDAVSLLHQCVANDATGQVPERMWGCDHRFRALWPDRLEIEFDQPIPAEVAVVLGWNRLAGTCDQPVETAVSQQTEVSEGQAAQAVDTGEPETAAAGEAEIPLEALGIPAVDMLEPEPSLGQPETFASQEPEAKRVNRRIARKRSTQPLNDDLQPVAKEFERLAKKLKQPSIQRADGRFPMYVIFSTHSGLVKQYGSQTAQTVEAEMKSLAETIKKRQGWSSLVFLPDDVENTRLLGLKRLDSIDPWKLKLALVDLDKSLAAKGSMIGAVLIVGGPTAAPFHRLPNPTDDADGDILSDNPYATLDSNYFVPEWPVGRLPGEEGPDAGLLLEQLRAMKINQGQVRRPGGWWQQVFFFLRFLNKSKPAVKPRNGKKGMSSFGYSAAVWRRSSLAVFRPVGEGQSMIVSPPQQSGSFENKKITDSLVSYYNLHGLPDSSEWYGQRDLSDSSDAPDYPVALSAKDLVKNGRAPSVVFSEACYGGSILNKREDQAIALRFLSIGSQAFVGSTCVSYGSISTPLIGADLLGFLFWKNLREGTTAGEALMNAKVQLAREMIKRQGFLDGEDQKTLLSFVLYGDPLARITGSVQQAKSIVRSLHHPSVKTICDRLDGKVETDAISADVLSEVKRAVESYLPGLDDVDIVVTHEHANCTGAHHQCPTSELGAKGKVETANGRLVVTISKQVREHEHVHRHYARATLDTHGKMVKLAISR